MKRYYVVGGGHLRHDPEGTVVSFADHQQELAELVSALKVFVDKYEAKPEGNLGFGFVNGDFIRAREILKKHASHIAGDKS